MCGIAGILYKNTAGRDTGKALIEMLDGCQHRGPDSTGFALYEKAHEDQLRLRFFIGEGVEAESPILQALLSILFLSMLFLETLVLQ